ncbi:MAG: NAD(P)-dependent alcohol dehydrogenase [Actinobacteria bacterium]|nr:NAD(P)-dependent alcohol dehydrogenase [Actinomycetota bacterium]
MKAVVLEKAKELVIKEIPIPEISEDEVLVKIREVGICGSDIHYYNQGRIGDFVIEKPIILGHESSGEIAAVGRNVKGLSVGDRVAIEPGVPCYKCSYCKAGKYNLCNKIVFMATPPHDGALCEYVKYDPHFVYKVPDSISFTEAALVEPLSVGYAAVIRCGIRPGDSVAILGCGPVGLAALEISKVMGASKVFASDLNAYRLNIAKRHGAFVTIDADKNNLVNVVHQYTEGEGCDCVIEASGAEKSISESLKVAKKGGTVVWIGLGTDVASIQYMDVIYKSLRVEGLFRYSNTYEPIIRLLDSGLISVSDWVSHRFRLEDIQKAINIANDPSINKLKIIIELS